MEHCNLIFTPSVGTTYVWCQIEECNGAGVATGATGQNSERMYTEITYYPTGSVGSGTPGFKMRTQSGMESPMLNDTIVVNVDGSAHGAGSAYALYNDLRELLRH